jgi:type I restriction enzyme M protein
VLPYTADFSQEKKKEWDGLLIPKSIMINEYFREEQEEIDSLTANRDELTQQLTELEEEHGGDEGFFSQLDKVNKANVAKRLKEIKKDKSAKDEMKVLETYLDINDRTTELNGKLKVTVQALDEALLEKYWALTETEIKELVIDRKWTNTIEQAVTSELESISQRLTQRIKELAERYETPLPKQNTEVAALEEVVNAHLQSMGFVWS